MQIDRRTILWAVIAVLFFVALFVTFKAGAGAVASSAGQAVSSAGSSASGGMVGGC